MLSATRKDKAMMDFSFSLFQRVIVGNGSFSRVRDLVRDWGVDHILILSGPNLKKMGLIDRILVLLKDAGMKASVFTEIEANPSVETVGKAAAFYQLEGCEALIALGGGSVMDVAKAVGLVVTYGGKITDYEGVGKVPGPVVPCLAVPTTAGSGSEVTAFSVITDHQRDYKLTVGSDYLLPKAALLDPELLSTAPASVAAACGIDAFIHALEAYLSKAASPFSEAMSEKAMELIGGSIRRFVANRGDKEAAEAMMVGSLFAGIAFSHARLGNVHAMSHPVSAFYDVAHGVANAVLLPVVIDYNALADHGKYIHIYNAVSPVKAEADSFMPGFLSAALRDLCLDIGIPQNLFEAIRAVPKYASITREEISDSFELMAKDAMKSGNIAVNPRTTTQRDIVALYQRALIS